MFRPITPTPMFWRDSSTIRALSLTSPPSSPWAWRQAASETTQSWSRSPPSPSGFSSLWFWPATNPSSEIEISHLSLLIVPPRRKGRLLVRVYGNGTPAAPCHVLQSAVAGAYRGRPAGR
jgi:hypothetical protein